MTSTLHPLLVRHAQSLGLQVIETPWPAWHGPNTVCADCDEDLSHEIAHWLLAPPSRRRRRWFGLGHPNNGGRGGGVTWSFALEEEKQASLLGILLERSASIDPMPTWRDHGWHYNISGAAAVLRELRRKGLYPVTL